MSELVDITPHPRILQVLGEIEFKPWQCIAELVDNSIDGFLTSARLGKNIPDPIVRVAFGKDTVVVKENGPGMSLATLENAVKAGWSSHELFGTLGLYGVGFNIATARLGLKTVIWSTREGDQEWFGLELDLAKLAKGGSYKLPAKTRIKADLKTSGSEVQVFIIKDDWKDRLANTSWVRSNITQSLSRVYGTMLRENNPQPIGFSLYIDNKKVSAWEHCVWPSDWDVFRKGEGSVRPIAEIDVNYGIKYLLRSTGEFCDSKGNFEENEVLEVPQRVYGWLGIQRYADEKDYGIDIIRNGRKIEMGCKDIFDWEDEMGERHSEYPIDDPRHRGRIVGELHLDHGYVHYTKHRFEREHSSWKQLLLAVRNNEPLVNRERYKFNGPNTSKLGVLYRTFRRNSPAGESQKWSDVLFIKDNEKARQWAGYWRKGEPEFRDDTKWREELQNCDKQDKRPVKEESGPELQPGDPLNPNLDGEKQTNGPITPPISRIPLHNYDLHITDIGVTGRSYDVEVYALENGADIPWRSRATPKGVYEIELNLEHPVFDSASLQVRDAVLAEMAYLITSEEYSSGGDTITYANVLATLRVRYSVFDSLNSSQLRADLTSLRGKILDKICNYLSPEKQLTLIQNLMPEDIKKIELARARFTNDAAPARHLDTNQIVQLLQIQPISFFDSGCFSLAWTPANLINNPVLLEEHRRIILQNLVMPLQEIAEFEKDDGWRNHSKTYLSLIRACVNIIATRIAD